ncbi:MAG: hypothetical protein Q8O67_34090 [Deltaproteobacteria bacterium]|nr:hypothetical protein [Deltaproteobacteria bacterium]
MVHTGHGISTQAAAALLMAAACNSESPVSPSRAAETHTADEVMVGVAGEVPSFGGLFVDESGVLHAYLSDPTDAAALELALATVVGGEAVADGIQIDDAQYGFAQLNTWHEAMQALFDVDGVSQTDIDEIRNRLWVGVDRAERIPAIEAEVVRLGIPAAAVAVEVTEPVQRVLTLRDQVRPLAGGLQIRFSSYLCSLGFNAVRAGISGFVTNSHCTREQGGVESTTYYQPLNAVAGERVGTEIADPVYSRSACPSSVRARCRYSDSAFVRLDAAVIGAPGPISKTDGVNTGSISLVASAFSVVGEAGSLVGQSVDKVGRTTGWTRGTVSRTCVNTGIQDSNIVLICQDHVTAPAGVTVVGSGDSGSPVFSITNNSVTDDVLLKGILWGGNSSGTTFVFSPIANVQRSTELGVLANCTNGC